MKKTNKCYKVQAILDIPIGHAILNYGPICVEGKNEDSKEWCFVIGYSEDKHVPGELCEQQLPGYEYNLAIKLRSYKQAEAYSDMFSEMAKAMRQSQKEMENEKETSSNSETT